MGILKDGTSASTSKSTKKLRGGRRKSSLVDVDNNNDVTRGSGDSAPRRSRSASRSRRVSTTTDIVDTGAARVRASSKKSNETIPIHFKSAICEIYVGNS